MKALASTSVPKGNWRYEIKFDGYRALGLFGAGSPKLWSRNANDLAGNYPEIAAALTAWPGGPALVDGEIVALDPEGRPSFQLLQGAGAGEVPLRYYVFDLLWHDGAWMLEQPLEVRQRALERLCERAPHPIRLSPVFELDPDQLVADVRKRGLEGIIAKAKGSRYETGRRSGAWKKYRLARDQEFVIGGITRPQGSRLHFGSLLVGYYEKGALHYAGKVGTGFDSRVLAALAKRFAELRSDTCPFVDLPMTRRPRFGGGMNKAAMRAVTWLRPEMVCQVRFAEWTHEGLLRHPVYLGLREDKSADEVVREPVAAG